MQHARRVDARIVAEEEDAVGLLEVVSVTVPTGTPMLSGKPTDVLSWHMLELSGRLLLPYIRANSAYM